MQRVSIVGGGGDMARVLARDLRARRSAIELVLADRDLAKAQRVAAALGIPDQRVLSVDVFDPARIREVVRGSGLVSAISRIDGAASTKSDGPQWCQAAFPVSVSRRV